jgi:hypothetical protein
MIYCRDVVEYLKTVPDASYDAVLCDPPYGLKFMNKRWDVSVPDSESWAEVLRVLKPGAPMLAFGGTRTVHRLVCAIEDAGFEIRDQLVYLYGKGFPKSQRADLAIDKTLGVEHAVTGERTLTGNAGMPTAEKGGTYGVSVGSAGNVVVPTKAAGSEAGQRFAGYGTALKPGHEPIVLARKPMGSTLGANLIEHGTGALNIDGCRLGGDPPLRFDITIGIKKDTPGIFGDAISRKRPSNGRPVEHGRWPSNVILDELAGEALDDAVGPRDSNPYRANDPPQGAVFQSLGPRTAGGQRERGLGPSRFFYCSKVSTREREDGCDRLPRRSAGEVTDREEDSAGLDSPRAGAGRTGGARNHHPTLKPISLTTYLARLLLPPPGGPVRRILVPYAGAGSEMIGAMMAGWDEVIGIERDAEYVAIAEARIRHWCEG